MSDSFSARCERWGLLTPTPTKQTVGFMIGSTFFAISAFPGFSSWAGAVWTNLLPFIGAWFFTTAGFMQWALTGPMYKQSRHGNGQVLSAAWLAAMTQALGALAFNVSTTAALGKASIHDERAYIWSPDAGGSLLFLVSGYFVIVSFSHVNKMWKPSDPIWWSSLINFLGCVAFGISAVGAFVSAGGNTLDPTVASWCTLIGAVGFFIASALELPQAVRPTRSA